MMKEKVSIDRLVSRYLYSLLNSFVNNAMRDRYLSLFSGVDGVFNNSVSVIM